VDGTAGPSLSWLHQGLLPWQQLECKADSFLQCCSGQVFADLKSLNVRKPLRDSALWSLKGDAVGARVWSVVDSA
jgi:hypothetical protein